MATRKNDGAGNSEPINPGDSVGSGSESGGAGIPDSIGGIPVADPSSVGPDVGGSADSGSQPPKRGRGRPPGSGAGKSASAKPGKEKAVPPNVSGIEKILYTIHLGVSEFAGIPELQIDRSESKLLAESLAELSSHYNFAPDPKVMAWVAMFGALGTVYGPRIAAMTVRKKTEPQNGEAPNNDGASPNGFTLEVPAFSTHFPQ